MCVFSKNGVKVFSSLLIDVQLVEISMEKVPVYQQRWILQYRPLHNDIVSRSLCRLACLCIIMRYLTHLDLIRAALHIVGYCSL